MQANPRVIAALQRNLERSCTLHERYLNLLTEERARLKTFAADDVERIRLKREELLAGIAELNAQRLEILSAVPDGTTRKLSELIDVETAFAPADAAVVRPLVLKLKKLASAVQEQSREFSQVVNLWSATQNVTRSYTAGGSLLENRTPTGTRLQTTLRQA
jgi:transposase